MDLDTSEDTLNIILNALTIFSKFVLACVLIGLFFWGVSGCSTINSTITAQAESAKKYTQGCKTVEKKYQLGAFNQQGGVETCEVKCSSELPKGYKYKYSRDNCDVSVGQ